MHVSQALHSSKLLAQLLISSRQVFRVNAGLSDSCHKVSVANPARQDVHVKMVGDSSSGSAAKIHPDVESIRVIDFTHRRLAAFRQIHHLVCRFLRRGGDFGDVRVGHDHRVAADVGIDVEDDEIVSGAVDDEFALVVPFTRQHQAEDAERLLLFNT